MERTLVPFPDTQDVVGYLPDLVFKTYMTYGSSVQGFRGVLRKKRSPCGEDPFGTSGVARPEKSFFRIPGRGVGDSVALNAMPAAEEVFPEGRIRYNRGRAFSRALQSVSRDYTSR